MTRSGNYYYLNHCSINDPEKFGENFDPFITDSRTIAEQFDKKITCIIFHTPDFCNDRYFEKPENDSLKSQTLTPFVTDIKNSTGLYVSNPIEGAAQVEQYKQLLEKFEEFS